MKSVLRDLLQKGNPIMKGANSIDPEDVEKRKIKIVICGDEKTGKSKLFDRIVSDSYTETYFQTIGSDYKQTNRIIPGANVDIDVWDTAGSPQYKDILPIFFRNADIVIIVFDVTNKKSYNSVPGYVSDARNWVEGDCDIAIFGTKIDSWKNPREVPVDDALQLSNRLNAQYFETSAVTTQGLEDSLRNLLNKALKRKKELPEWLMSTPRDNQE